MSSLARLVMIRSLADPTPRCSLAGWLDGARSLATVVAPTEPQAERKASADLQAVFDHGSEVGDAARGYVPGGLLIDLPYKQLSQRVDATRAAIDAGRSRTRFDSKRQFSRNYSRAPVELLGVLYFNAVDAKTLARSSSHRPPLLRSRSSRPDKPNPHLP